MSKLIAPEFRIIAKLSDIVAELRSITRGQIKTVQRRQYCGLTLFTAAVLCSVSLLPTTLPAPVMLAKRTLLFDPLPVTVTRVCSCGQSFLLTNGTAHVLCLNCHTQLVCPAYLVRREVARG